MRIKWWIVGHKMHVALGQVRWYNIHDLATKVVHKMQWRNRRGQGCTVPPGGICRAGQAIVPGWRGYRRRGKKEGKKAKEEREDGKQKEKREKKGKLKITRGKSLGMCQDRTRPYNSDYGAPGSTLQSLRGAWEWEHITVTTVRLGACQGTYIVYRRPSTGFHWKV